VRSVLLSRPPITTVARLAAMRPSSLLGASGIRARIVAAAVFRMERTWVRPPCITTARWRRCHEI
jgi:hypothetical protein